MSESAERTVLIADNDLGVRNVLAEVLRRRGLSVDVADDGGVAAERMSRGDIAVLVCDLDMPRVSGEALLDRMAGWDVAPPVVVVSGFVDDRVEAALATRAIVRHVLRKPFDIMKFADLVAALAAPGRDAAGGEGRSLFEPG